MELADKGIGYVNPNPLVGAVLVKDKKIIGEGFHKNYGGNHGEIEAFLDADNKGNSVENSTMYVTLEPCFHYGKTPPCVLEIIKRKVGKVVIGMEDPNPLVSGKSIDLMKKNGIEVVVGILKEDIEKQNEVFLKYIKTKEPFVIMKTAMSLDGKIACYTGDSKWISNEKSRKYVHKLRHKMSAIMVGVNTIIKDNPMLNTRLEIENPSDTIKIIVDSTGRIPLTSNVLRNNSKKDIILATTEKLDVEVEKVLSKKGIKILKTVSIKGKVDLKVLMKKLGEMKIDSIFLEGGGTLNYSSLNCKIVDKVESFISPIIVGGVESKTPVEGEGFKTIGESIKLKDLEFNYFDNDILVKGYIMR